MLAMAQTTTPVTLTLQWLGCWDHAVPLPLLFSFSSCPPFCPQRTVNFHRCRTNMILHTLPSIWSNAVVDAPARIRFHTCPETATGNCSTCCVIPWGDCSIIAAYSRTSRSHLALRETVSATCTQFRISDYCSRYWFALHLLWI